MESIEKESQDRLDQERENIQNSSYSPTSAWSFHLDVGLNFLKTLETVNENADFDQGGFELGGGADYYFARSSSGDFGVGIGLNYASSSKDGDDTTCQTLAGKDIDCKYRYTVSSTELPIRVVYKKSLGSGGNALLGFAGAKYYQLQFRAELTADQAVSEETDSDSLTGTGTFIGVGLIIQKNYAFNLIYHPEYGEKEDVGLYERTALTFAYIF